MPLDPHLAGVLQLLAQSGAPPLHQASVEQSRAAYLALTHGSRTADQVVPVGRVQDTTVPGASGPLAGRVYWPEGEGPWPAVAFFHGGGYVLGDLDTHDNMCRDICRGAQAVVIAVDYRLAPEHPFPAGLEDAVAATTWIAGQLPQWGASAMLGLAGDSAGGNFCAVVAQQLRETGVNLAAQLLIYPSVDHAHASYPSMDENGEGYFLERASMQWFQQHYLGDWADERDVRLAPLRHKNLADLPPALIVVAEFDPLRDAGAAYCQALQDAGGHAELLQAKGMIHGFFDMGRWSPAAQQWIARSTARFGYMLRNP